MNSRLNVPPICRIRRVAWGGLLPLLSAVGTGLPPLTGLAAQGVTTVSIRGTVGGAGGASVDGADVTVSNEATGFVAHAVVRHGRFVIHGLDVGGPYTIGLRRLGYHPLAREGVYLHLGEPFEVHFVLHPAAVPLEPVNVVASAAPAASQGGTATTVPDSLLHRLPTLNRNLYDFVRLAPQISTRIGLDAGGMSVGGMGFRLNNYLIDGVPQRSISGSQPLEFAAGRSVPFAAVAEYQLLVAPFDVRYGDFAGGLVNAVTRSGSNRLEASAFAYARNDALARSDPAVPTVAYERVQYGVSVGGPLRRDRAHFFVATELQHFSAPAPGPYIGQPDGVPPPVSEADVSRLGDILRTYGLHAGTGGAVANRNPLTNLFARADLALPERASRVTLSLAEGRSRNQSFSRPPVGAFPLSTYAATQATASRTFALQIHTALPRLGGGHNQLIVSRTSIAFGPMPAVRQPIVEVRVPGAAGGVITVVTGTPPHAHGTHFGPYSSSIHLRDDLTVPVGAKHTANLGLEAEWFRVEREGVPYSYGSWTFASLEALEAGTADRYEIGRDFGSAGVPIGGAQFGAWVGDQWRASAHLLLTMGLRADLLAVGGRAPYDAAVDSIFGRRTDRMPRPRVELSPRLGFTWDLSDAARDRLRGGLGVFTGRPPVGWLHAPLYAYGVGIGRLRCGALASDSGPPPAFDPDYRAPPIACADGTGLTTPPRGDVELVDPALRMARTVRGVLAYERRLPGDLLGTVEALVTRSVSDFVFVNLGLEGPQGIDRHGRVLYGTFDSTGAAEPKRLSTLHADVVELRNSSRTRAWQLSARVARPFAGWLAGVAQYTWSRVRDVQTPLRVNVPAIVNWSSRAVSGRHDDLGAGISLNDIPHRVVLAGSARAPWRRWSTELSFSYVGEAGSPFTHVARGVGLDRGDLNADGSNTNDPIYVPRDASDTAEIRFAPRIRQVPVTGGGTRTDTISTAQQAVAFDDFIRRTPCLRRQRGQIVARNSCRGPWTHTTIVSVRQSIPIANRSLEAQLDIHNLLNLLDSGWGLHRLAVPAVLEHVDQTPGMPETSQPVFRFDPLAARWPTLPVESAFQLQFGLRYRF